MSSSIIDTFDRVHTYLRISLTDKCNLRCTYCMPKEDMQFMPNKHLMQADEIEYLAKIFIELGVKKIRLTGGEPLIRKDFAAIVNKLGVLSPELTLTTNAIWVDKYLSDFKQANIKSLNVSLDTLDATKFQQITRRDHLQKTQDHIDLLLDHGFVVKLNTVVMKGINDDEINDFVALTLVKPNLHVRFIEFMPFNGNQWDMSKIVSYDTVLSKISEKFQYVRLPGELQDTSHQFRVDGAKSTFGIIGTVTHPFCSGCNRIRLTADGKLKNCLFDTSEVDLLTSLRNGEDIKPIILNHFSKKYFAHGGHGEFSADNAKAAYETNRTMIAIGG